MRHLPVPRPIAPAHLLVLALVSCGGGGGGGDGGSATTQLSYEDPDATYLVSVPIEANTPGTDMKGASWTIAPSLPAGLTLDASTGVLSGTPEEESPRTSYLVTAQGPGGKAEAQLHVSVALPPRIALVANADDTIGVHTVDPWTAVPRYHALQHHEAPDAGAEHLVVHPSGELVYVANRGGIQQDSTVSAYRVDPQDGEMVPLGHAPVGEGPHRLAVHPSGEHLYALSYATHRIWVYSIDQVSGVLTPLDQTQTNTGPERLAIDPLGRFLYVTHRPSADIRAFRIDSDTGLLESAGGGFNYFDFIPADVGVGPEGRFAYIAFEVTENIVAYEIDQQTGEIHEGDVAFTSGRPRALVVHPNASFAYVACDDTDTVDSYALDPVTGEPVQMDSRAVGDAPSELILDESGRWLYVLGADSDDVTVLGVDEVTGQLSPLGVLRTRASAVAIGLIRGDTPAFPRADTLYSLNAGSPGLEAFAVDANTGLLTTLGEVPVGAQPVAQAIDPWGRYAVVAGSDRTLQVFLVEPSGALTPAQPHELATTPSGISVGPAGEFLFLGLVESEELAAFRVDAATGAMVETDRVPLDGEPGMVSVDPTGHFVYVAEVVGGSDILTGFRFQDGAFVGPAHDAPAPGGPGRLAFSPDGNRAYVALHGSKLIVPYDVDPVTGSLSPLPKGSVGTDVSPWSVAVHASGQHAYAAVPGEFEHDGHLGHYAIDPETGALSEVQRHLDGLSPVDVVLGPDGAFLYVANEDGDDLGVHAIDGEAGMLELVGVASTGPEPRELVVRTRVD